MIINDEFHLAMGRALHTLCDQQSIPVEALQRLMTPEGSDTMMAITLRIATDYAERPKLSPDLIVKVCPQDTGLPSSDPPNIIFVPDLDAAALTAFAKERCKMTSVDSTYAHWNYLVDFNRKPISGRGKKFEVMTWKSDRDVSSEEVRRYFQVKGFHGHTAAFIAWIAQQNPEGDYASLPEDSACQPRPHGELAAPTYHSTPRYREISSSHIRGVFQWHSSTCFLAFREL